MLFLKFLNFLLLYFVGIHIQSMCIKNDFYRISVTVFYDDEYKKELGSKAESHIQNAMGMVEEMYTEFKKWNTMMEIDLKEIKHVRDRCSYIVDGWMDGWMDNWVG